MAGTTITGLSPSTFPLLSTASMKQVPVKAIYTEKEWAYIDAYRAHLKAKAPDLLEWNPYPEGTLFDNSGDPLNCKPHIVLLAQLVDKHGDYPNNDTPPSVVPDSSQETYGQQNVDYHRPWRCHTCGGVGSSVLHQEATSVDEAYEIVNGLDCPACHGTGKEACPMYDMLSEDDQKTEYKAHLYNGDF